jgi:hypothetical protein
MGSRLSACADRWSCWTCLTTDDVRTINHHFTALFQNSIAQGNRLAALEERLATATVHTCRGNAAPPEYEQFRAVLDRLTALEARLAGPAVPTEAVAPDAPAEGAGPRLCPPRHPADGAPPSGNL